MNSRTPLYCMSILLLSGFFAAGCSDKNTMAPPNVLFQSDEPVRQTDWQPEKVVPNYTALAQDLIARKHYEVALGQLIMALEEGTRSAEVYYLQGVCLRETDQSEEALASFAKALQYDDHYAKAHNGMGMVYVKNRDFPKAIEAFRQAVELDPARADFINNLGYAYLMDKQFTEAEHYLGRSLAIDPEYMTARNNLALCYGYLQRDRDAFQVLREKVTAQVAYHNMAVIYQLLGKQNNAAEAEKKAAALKQQAALKPKPFAY